MAPEGRTFRKRLNGSIFTLMLVTGVIFLVVMGVALLGDDPGRVGITVFVLCLILTLWLMTMRVTLTVSADGLKVSMLGIFSERIPIGAIKSVVPGPVTGIKHGAGARFVGNDLGYLVGGDSVRIDTSKQSLLVSVDSPEDVIRAIDEAKTGAAGN